MAPFGTCSRLQGTSASIAAPFPPGHLHDGDVEGVGDVGGAGQVPAAVETLRVVVGPAHQHWLFWGSCRGKRKGNYSSRWAYHQLLNKGMSLLSQLEGDMLFKESPGGVNQLEACPVCAAEIHHETLLWTVQRCSPPPPAGHLL